MAIIKYSYVNGIKPEGITSAGYWYQPVGRTYIGIGSGVGTELSIDELKTYVKSLKPITKITHIEWENGAEALSSQREPIVCREPTDSEMESSVDAWCTKMGVS